MSVYEKLLKGILSNKRKLKEFETIALSKKVMLSPKQNATKLKDLRSFSIPCIVGNESFNIILYDLGTSISLMPFSICKKTRYRRTQAHDGYSVANR